MPKSPLVYLREQLQFQLVEWKMLDNETKEWYRKAAYEEMEVLGIEHS